METSHKEKILLYLCPVCDLGFRWPNNFPTHYEKMHHFKYQDGLAMIKSLKTKVIDNKGKQLNNNFKNVLKSPIYFSIFEQHGKN